MRQFFTESCLSLTTALLFSETDGWDHYGQVTIVENDFLDSYFMLYLS